MLSDCLSCRINSAIVANTAKNKKKAEKKKRALERRMSESEVTKNDLGRVSKKNIFSFFHPVSNFLGIELIRPWFSAVVHSDFLA